MPSGDVRAQFANIGHDTANGALRAAPTDAQVLNDQLIVKQPGSPVKVSVDALEAQRERARTQPYLRLNDGTLIPQLGLGTWNAQGNELKNAVKAAIYAGYRHIDTASNYRNEHIVGEAIAECFAERVCTRDELFVTTKVWNNSHTRLSVPQALLKSLKALQLAYVDLYLVHYPIGYKEGDVLSPTDAGGQVITTDVDYVETWLGMEDCKRMGLTRSIGVSNFNARQIGRVVDACTIMPVTNQVECHPYLTQQKLLDYCQSKGNICLTAYSPLGSPGRHDPRLGAPYLIEDPCVVAIARKHARPAAHILIRYQLQRGVVVIPKAIQPAHIESNFDALNFELSAADMAKLEALNKSHRFMRFERCIGHKYYPFDDEF